MEWRVIVFSEYLYNNYYEVVPAPLLSELIREFPEDMSWTIFEKELWDVVYANSHSDCMKVENILTPDNVAKLILSK
jgi:hypothetical protein